MTRTARPTSLARRLVPAAPVVAALLLSGCGGAVRTGAAATVGSDRITTTTLQGVVDRGLADPQAAQQLGSDRPAFQRQVLSRLITGDLLRDAAASKGVQVTDGEVDARMAQFASQLGGQSQLEAQAAQSGIARQDLRPFVRDLTLNDKLADTLVQGKTVTDADLKAAYQKNIAQYDQVTARHILLKTQAEAQQVLAQVKADPATFAAIASARSLDTGSKAKGGQLDPAGRGAYVKPFEDALFSAKPGTFGIVHTQYGFHVYEVLKHQTTTLAQATPALRRSLLQPQRQQAVSTLLRSTAKKNAISVNPRFGRWDDQTGGVVDAATSGPGVVSSPAVSPGAGRTGTAGGAAPQEQSSPSAQ